MYLVTSECQEDIMFPNSAKPVMLRFSLTLLARQFKHYTTIASQSDSTVPFHSGFGDLTIISRSWQHQKGQLKMVFSRYKASYPLISNLLGLLHYCVWTMLTYRTFITGIAMDKKVMAENHRQDLQTFCHIPFTKYLS